MLCTERVSRIVVWPLAICAVMALTSCSGSRNESEQTSTPTAAADEYDLSKLSELEDDFPPGFIPGKPEVLKLQHVWVASVGSVVSSGKQFTVDPSRCQVLLKPVNGEAGADTIGIRADGLEERTIAVGADMPVTVAGQIPATGCDRTTYAVPDDDYPRTGTVERIAAPSIDRATTLALKITTDGFPDPEYSYVAILDNRVFVDVQARLAPDFKAQPLLPDLLVNAVAAIRG
jgi:Domain of unknown function (DUF5642)